MPPNNDLIKAAQQNQIDVVREIGFMGYRFLITLNSGAFIVLLTFVGNVGKNTGFSMDLQHLKIALFCFMLAISGTFISMTVAYISAQLSLLNKSMPFGEGGIGHVSWLLVPVICSFLLFCLGGYYSITGIASK